MGPLSQQLQASSSRASEPLSNHGLSPGSLVDMPFFLYVPFFRTYGQLLAEEEWAPQPEVCRDQGGNWGVREAQFWEFLEPPSGYFPYYRSKEENFPRLLRGGSQDPPTRKEVQAGCFCRRKVSIGSPVSGEGHMEGPQKGAGSSPGPRDLLPTSVPGPQTPVGQAGSPHHPGSAGAPGALSLCVIAQRLEADDLTQSQLSPLLGEWPGECV